VVAVVATGEIGETRARQRQTAGAQTGGGEDGDCDGCAHRPVSDLTGAEWRFVGAVDDHDLDQWCVLEP
jgi:hypothetical protein